MAFWDCNCVVLDGHFGLEKNKQEKIKIQRGVQMAKKQPNKRKNKSNETKKLWQRPIVWILGCILLVVGIWGLNISQSKEEDFDSINANETSFVPYSAEELIGVTMPIDVDPATGEVKFPATQTILSEEMKQETCQSLSGSYMGLPRNERFLVIAEQCEGNQQAGSTQISYSSEATLVSLKVTMPGVRVNGVLIEGLMEGLRMTGYGEGLGYPGLASMIFHWDDGSDGLQGGNLIDGGPRAITAVVPGVSATFTSIPVNFDNTGNIEGTATELCQIVYIDNPDTITAERLCNGYGMAASAAYHSWPYQQYEQLTTQVLLWDGNQALPAIPVSDDVYNHLLEQLQSQPDLFELK